MRVIKWISGFAFLFIVSCSITKTLFIQPDYFPKPVYDFKNNLPTTQKVLLGQQLFYDPILSADNTISCSSCHSPFNGFAHSDHDLSHGIHDQIGTRNAPALMNLAWHKNFMWDGAIHHLDVQALAPISHAKEMGSNIQEVLTKLKASPKYRALFYKTYHDSMISTERLLKVLAQFQLTLISDNSKYDSVQRKSAVFSEQEKKGYLLFKKNCNSCHTEPLFSTYNYANNGLATDSTLNDNGRYAITQSPADSLTFKIPSLRNLSYTAPYMHDGRFKTLHQVLNHYTNGIVHSATLDEKLGSPITLSGTEKVDLIAFLLSLNDRHFVFNKQHSFPPEKNNSWRRN